MPITPQQIQAAVNVGRYFAPHAKAAFLAYRSRKRQRNSATRYTTKSYKAGGLSYRTTGRLKKFKKPQRKVRKNPKTATTGMEYRKESGGTITDPHTVYVGHSSIATDTLLVAWMGAIVRALYQKAGRSFDNWNDNMSSGYTIKLSYFDTASSTSSSSFEANTGGISYHQLIINLLTAMRVSHTTARIIEFREALMFRSVDGDRMSYIKLDSASINISCSSSLTVQNRTLAGVSATADVDDNVGTNISNNPLRFRSYEGKGNGFVPAERIDGDVSYIPFIGTQAMGVITNTSALSAPRAGLEPPPAWYFKGTQKTGKGVVDPGNIHKSFVKTNTKMSFAKFALSLASQIDASSVDHTPMGSVRMFALEKVLNSRVGENSVSVGWEIDYKVHVSISYSDKCAIPAYVEV